jgi:excisionase family DNA binding protein
VAKDDQWITVQEVARRLGVKEDAIRKRMQRGTLEHEKDSNDGRVYVFLDAAQDRRTAPKGPHHRGPYRTHSRARGPARAARIP